MKREEWLKERIEHYFEEERYNCAQTSAMVIAEACDMDPQMFARVLNGFGGGVAGSRNVCGALTGAIAAVCEKTSRGCGRAQDEAGYNVANDLARELFEAFESCFSTALCARLTGVERGDAQAQKAFLESGGHERVCGNCVFTACKLAIAMLDKAE